MSCNDLLLGEREYSVSGNFNFFWKFFAIALIFSMYQVGWNPVSMSPVGHSEGKFYRGHRFRRKVLCIEDNKFRFPRFFAMYQTHYPTSILLTIFCRCRKDWFSSANIVTEIMLLAIP